LKARM